MSGAIDQFIYDNNGNMTDDRFQDNSGLKYDHRNLLIEISRLISENEIELTRYYYDEAGNRIRKLILRHWASGGGVPDPPDWSDIENLPIYEPEGEGGEGWSIYKNEFYIRGVGGNTIAEYDWETLQQWNVYGTDNVGKIVKDDTEENKFYYLKDHLGSIRAVIDEDNNCVSAQDYDMWGYLLENRTFDIDREKYKFTGKERDDESSYDYFGARYYMSRIGRWGQTEPLINKYPNISPYCYTMNNPLLLIDPTGMWTAELYTRINKDNTFSNYIVVTAEEGDNLQSLYSQLGVTADDFAEMYDINNIASYKVTGGKTSFDITSYVVSNSGFDPNKEKSKNSFGYVSFVKDKSLKSENQIQGQYFKRHLGTSVDIPKTGDIAIFYLLENWSIEGFVITTDDPQHAGIFLIETSSGVKQFLNRKNTGLEVGISTISDVVSSYNEAIESKRKSYPDIPDLNPKPKYYQYK